MGHRASHGVLSQLLGHLESRDTRSVKEARAFSRGDQVIHGLAKTWIPVRDQMGKGHVTVVEALFLDIHADTHRVTRSQHAPLREEDSGCRD